MHQWSVVVRDLERELRYELPSELVMALVAGLSGDPETIEELASNSRRFLGDRWHEEWLRDHQSSSRDRLCRDEDYGIDLPGRLIVHSARSPEPPRMASVSVSDAVREDPYLTEYHLSDEWEINCWKKSWREACEQRRESRRVWLRDGRKILYEELSAGLIVAWRHETQMSNCGDASQTSLTQLAESAQCKLSDRSLGSLISRIHARWLLTPIEGLQGRTPRDLLVDHVEHIGLDRGQRIDQSIATGRSFDELSSSSPAYTGPYIGPLELIFYHQLVETLIRRLLVEMMERRLASRYRGRQEKRVAGGRRESATGTKISRAQREFLESAIRKTRLDALPEDVLQEEQAGAVLDDAMTRELIRVLDWQQSEFLDQVGDSLCGYSPGMLVTLERKRLPITVGDDYSPEACDCPLCALMEHQTSMLLWDPVAEWLPTDFVFSSTPSFDSWTPELSEEEIDEAWRGDERVDEVPDAVTLSARSTNAKGVTVGRNSSDLEITALGTTESTTSDTNDSSDAVAPTNMGYSTGDPISDFDNLWARAKRQRSATQNLEFRCLVRMLESPIVMAVNQRDGEDPLMSSPAFQNLFEVGGLLAAMIDLINRQERKTRDRKQAVKRLNEHFGAVRDLVANEAVPNTVNATIRKFQHTINRYTGRFPELHEHVEGMRAALNALQDALLAKAESRSK